MRKNSFVVVDAPDALAKMAADLQAEGILQIEMGKTSCRFHPIGTNWHQHIPKTSRVISVVS